MFEAKVRVLLILPREVMDRARVFTGEATRSRYSVGLVDFMVKYGTYGHDCAELAVR